MEKVDILINITDTPYEKWGDREKQQGREIASDVIDAELPHLSTFADDDEIQTLARKIVNGVLKDPETKVTFLMPKTKHPLLVAIQERLKEKHIGFYQVETKMLIKGRQTKYGVFNRFVCTENK